MLAANQILQKRYRIVRQLGHGGMGAVYEAQDERLGSAVALKEIIVEIEKIPTESGRELFRRAFEREAKLLANLHHEVFPRVMDYFSEQNRQFLIMELVSGDDLSERLSKTGKPFAFAETVRWADHLLDALDYLHTRKPPIFHRDIKPQNLKATSRGKIKLLDFGIAKSVDQSSSTMTNQTFVGATLDYAPIEQILPAITPTFREFIVLKHNEKATAVLEQSTDARCDLYSVGATFYHLLTNRVPVDSAKRTLEIWEGNLDPLPNPSAVNPDIPPTVSAWLLKALEIERENRFASAIEMQEALQTALDEAKADYKTADKTRILPVEKAKENPTEAKTENLPEIKQSQINTEQKIILGIKAAPTQPLENVPVPTQSSLPKEAVTESLPIESAETNSSGSISKPEITGTAYFDEKIVEERKPEPLPARAVTAMAAQPQAKSGFNFLWLVPIFGLAVLTVIGIGGGMFLMNSASPANLNNSTPNQKIFTSTETPAPSISPTDSPTPTPTAAPTQSISNNKINETIEKPKPTIAPTTAKTPAPKPTIAPQTQRTDKKPDHPKPKPTKNPGCVYNGDC